MSARPPTARPAAILLALAAACGAAGERAEGEPSEPTEPGAEIRRTGGPLANAGADRQVLEGQLVRLDAGSSQRGEAGRPLHHLWTVEPGPGLAVPLAIDDPAARRIRVVAPLLAPGLDHAEVRLRLRVDDGVDRAEDVVRLVVVRDAAGAIAPVASAGPDVEVVAGAEVRIGPRPAEGSRPADDAILETCAGPCPAPTVTWTLVEGTGATLRPIEAPAPGDGCVAPCARVETDASLGDGAGPNDVVAVLSYRVDVVSAATGLAAAPDFVRVFVKKSAPHPSHAPTVTLSPAGPWYAGTNLPLQVYGDAPDALGFRPVLGEAAPVPGGAYGYRFEHAAPELPALLGWAFEGRRDRLRSAPRFLLVDWRGLPAPVADAGPDPVHLVDGEALPPDGCDRVRLFGATLGTARADESACAQGRAHPSLEFCWTQTHGPAALAGVPAACGPRSDRFESGSLLAGCDSDLACPDLVASPPSGEGGRTLAFELKVRQRAQGETPASAWSPVDTAAVRVIAGSRDDPPAVRLALFRRLGDGSHVPLAGPLVAGETVVVDASGSVDPEGLPLAVTVEAVGVPAIEFAPHEPCAVPGACFAATAPAVEGQTTYPLRVAVTDGETTTVCGLDATGGVCLDREGAPLEAPALVVDGPPAAGG